METVRLSEYRRHLSRTKSAGSYFIFYRHYFKILTRLTALFLQDIANLADCDRVIREDVDGEEYFLCTAEFLRNSASGWNSEEQKWHLTALKEKGFVKTMRRGCPARRWVHIDYRRIEQAIDEALGDQSEGKSRDQLEGKFPNLPEDLPSGNKEQGKNGHKKELASQGRRPKASPSDHTSPFLFGKPKRSVEKRKFSPVSLEWTDKLRAAQEKKARRKVKINRFAWARTFDGVRERVADDDRIEGLLNWYCRNDVLDQYGNQVIAGHPAHFEKILGWIESEKDRQEQDSAERSGKRRTRTRTIREEVFTGEVENVPVPGKKNTFRPQLVNKIVERQIVEERVQGEDGKWRWRPTGDPG